MASSTPTGFLSLDLYPLVRWFLFRLDPEVAHHLTIACLKRRLCPEFETVHDPLLTTQITTRIGTQFTLVNPLGLAAGFDKQAEVMPALFNFGFSFIEVGSITPLPQPGNPKPRLLRVPEVEGVINRFGFNSDGIVNCYRRLADYRARTKQHSKGLLGINIGKNKESVDAAADYVTGVKAFADLADYLTVNISSPNTPGLRDLQRREPLKNLIAEVLKARDATKKKPPLFIKVSPDLTPEQREDLVDVAMNLAVDGLIIGNTTITRPQNIPETLRNEAGGLSGRPLLSITLPVLADFYRLTRGQLPLIGCGGIMSGSDAYAMIQAGASLLQLYTALIYSGPAIVNKINDELVFLLKRDGCKNIQEAVGQQHRALMNSKT